MWPSSAPPASGPAGRRAAGRADALSGRLTDGRGPAHLEAAAESLFEALRRHRLGLAREAGVAPFVIASDRMLRDIARLRPRTLTELELAHGIGPHKLERYGEGLLRVVREAGGSP